MRIGIISDTHGLLRPEVIESLDGCEAILHGGDINKQEIIDQLEKISPVYAVRGNNDKEWAEHLPLFIDTQVMGLRVYMTHKKKDLPEDLSPYDLVIYGHSHKYEEKREGDTILLNPGSCGPRRFNQPITMAVLHLSAEGQVERIEKIDIPHQGPQFKADDLKKKDIEKIEKLMLKGKTYAEIAKTLHLEEAVAEQVCRLYSTHPGVDAEGVMRKMGL
jgi:putative phosphoesterase